MTIQAFAKRLSDLGCETNIEGENVFISIDGNEVSLKLEDDWLQAMQGFYKARQYKFDGERRALLGNRTAEYQLTRLDPGYFFRNEHDFADRKENVIRLGPASKQFLLAYYESDRYERSFTRIRERIDHRCKMRNEGRKTSRPTRLGTADILLNFYTAKYTAKRKPRNTDLDLVAIERIRACLFSLSFQRGECWEVACDVRSRGFVSPNLVDENESLEIPTATYDPSVVSFYKIAKSSQFPGQIFLSYYHVLEYHFLRVADEALYGAVRIELNNPSFEASYENVSKLVATIKKNDTTVDEKQMLRDVLLKYVPEDDFIRFVETHEEERGERTFSGSKQQIFGEYFSVKLEKGHALSNAAALLKHIRNALVHSSDRYSRNDTFMPFSESEEVVVKYLPLVQYLAERVIFATAT